MQNRARLRNLTPLAPLVVAILGACSSPAPSPTSGSTSNADAPSAGRLPTWMPTGGSFAERARTPARETTPDGAPDPGSPSNPVQGPITVIVSDPTIGPVAGATVVFDDVSGTRSIVQTDANGAATHVVTPGATVTVAIAQPSAIALTTIAGVDTPSVIHVGEPRVGYSAIAYDMAVAAFSGATRYVADFGCGTTANPSPDAPALGTISTLCLDGDGAARVLVKAEDAASKVLAFARASATPDAGHASVAIGAGAWSSVAPPSMLSVAGAALEARAITGEIFYVEGPLAYSGESGAAPFAFVRPPAVASAELLTASVLAQSATARTGRVARRPLGAGDVIEAASDYLPNLSAPVVTVRAGTPSLAFTATGSLSNATGIVARIHSEAAGVPVSWTLVSPPGVETRLTPPALPTELATLTATEPWRVQFVTALESPSWRYSSFQTDAMKLWKAVRNRAPAALGPSPVTVRYTTVEP